MSKLGTRGLTFVELVISLGVCSVVVLLLVELMGEPAKILSSATSQLSSSQSVNSGIGAILNQLNSSGILRTDLVRCENYTSAFATRSGEIEPLQLNKAETGKVITIPFSFQGGLGAKMRDPLGVLRDDRLSVADVKSFPAGALVAVSQVRDSSRGRIFVVESSTVTSGTSGFITLVSAGSLPPPFNHCTLNPSSGAYANLRELLNDSGAALKLFGNTPEVFRLDRLGLAAYQTDGKQLFSQVLEAAPVELDPVMWKSVVLSEGFGRMKIGFNWKPDSTSHPTMGKMFMKVQVDQEESLSTTSAASANRRLAGDAQYSYLGGAGTNFVVNTAPQPERVDTTETCTVFLRNVTQGLFSVDPAVSLIDPFQLYQVTGTSTSRQKAVVVSFGGSLARCWEPANTADSGQLSGPGIGDTVLINTESALRPLTCELPRSSYLVGQMTYYSTDNRGMVTTYCNGNSVVAVPNETIALAWTAVPACNHAGSVTPNGVISVTRTKAGASPPPPDVRSFTLAYQNISGNCTWTDPGPPSVTVNSDCNSAGEVGNLEKVRFYPFFPAAYKPQLDVLIAAGGAQFRLIGDATTPTSYQIEVDCAP